MSAAWPATRKSRSARRTTRTQNQGRTSWHWPSLATARGNCRPTETGSTKTSTSSSLRSSPANSRCTTPRPSLSLKGGGDDGDMVVDLPLTLEKIIVERRTHVIHATEQLPASPDDVLLGSLLAEYEKPADKTDEAVRLSRLRMPVASTAP